MTYDASGQPGYPQQPAPQQPPGQQPYQQPYPQAAYPQPYPQAAYPQAYGYGPVGYASPANRTVAALLAFFFGALGVHRFYVGKVGTGILQLLTVGGLGIWALIDFIMILVGAFRDKNGLPLLTW